MDRPLASRNLRRSLTSAVAAVIGLLGVHSSLAGSEDHHHMTLHSATFLDGGPLPLSMIYNIPNDTGRNRGVKSSLKRSSVPRRRHSTSSSASE